MTTIDWTTPARLMERVDGGSDLYFDFMPIADGNLKSLVRDVIARAPADRQRIVIDAGALGTLAIGQILELAERADFPAE